jgi:pentose-5-phosphate-3-epimerase
MKIVPTLQTETTDEFSAQLHRLLPYFSRYSVDIQDGSFTPSRTISSKEVLEIFSENPVPKNILFDFDIMVTDYENCLKDIEKIAERITVNKVVVHFSFFKGKQIPTSDNIIIGPALDFSDNIEDLDYLGDLNKIPVIQIMTIHSGPQGQPFNPEMLNKIATLRKYNYRNEILIDGAVNDQSLPIILQQTYLPDIACVGSYLSHAGERFKERIKYLQTLHEQSS